MTVFRDSASHLRPLRVSGAFGGERHLALERLQQYGLVRIWQLLRPPDEYDNWQVNQRPPQIGDEGTLLEILHARGLPDLYVVESVGENGRTVWLADFAAEELEPFGE